MLPQNPALKKLARVEVTPPRISATHSSKSALKKRFHAQATISQSVSASHDEILALRRREAEDLSPLNPPFLARTRPPPEDLFPSPRRQPQPPPKVRPRSEDISLVPQRSPQPSPTVRPRPEDLSPRSPPPGHENTAPSTRSRSQVAPPPSRPQESPVTSKRSRVEVTPPPPTFATYRENPAMKKPVRVEVAPPHLAPAAHSVNTVSNKRSRPEVAPHPAASSSSSEHAAVRKHAVKVNNRTPRASSSNMPPPGRSQPQKPFPRGSPDAKRDEPAHAPRRVPKVNVRRERNASQFQHPIFKRWVPTRWKGNHRATADRMGRGKLGIAPALRTDNFAKLVKAMHQSLLEAETTAIPILQDLKWTQEAMILFQNQFETHMQLYLTDGSVAMRHAKRKTFYPDDLVCANRIKGKEAARLTANCHGGPM